MSDHHDKSSTGGHHILPDGLILKVGAALGVLTIITVAIAQVDLGPLNFLVAMLVATFKASLVALFFMGLKYDHKENAVIFTSSFLFLAIFFVFTATDLFFRGDVYVKAGATNTMTAASGGQKSKIKDPWKATPELIARGKAQFAQNCVSCHGAEGKGDGPAAASMNPRPRNFSLDAGWKNGRKVSQIFKTLKEGLPGTSMASFGTLGVDDRWAISHYVQSVGPKVEEDSVADLAKIGVDPATYGSATEAVAQEIPLEFAVSRIAVAEARLRSAPSVAERSVGMNRSQAERLFRSDCASCHGVNGEGGIKVKALGGSPAKAFLATRPFSMAENVNLRSAEAFGSYLVQGTAGSWHPSRGNLTGAQLSELYGLVKSLAK